jgi:hypothetical protein
MLCAARVVSESGGVQLGPAVSRTHGGRVRAAGQRFWGWPWAMCTGVSSAAMACRASRWWVPVALLRVPPPAGRQVTSAARPGAADQRDAGFRLALKIAGW